MAAVALDAELVEAAASELHAQYMASRAGKPRWKSIRRRDTVPKVPDSAVEGAPGIRNDEERHYVTLADGTVLVDIANTRFKHLPEVHRKENLVSVQQLMEVMVSAGASDIVAQLRKLVAEWTELCGVVGELASEEHMVLLQSASKLVDSLAALVHKQWLTRQVLAEVEVEAEVNVDYTALSLFMKQLDRNVVFVSLKHVAPVIGIDAALLNALISTLAGAVGESVAPTDAAWFLTEYPASVAGVDTTFVPAPAVPAVKEEVAVPAAAAAAAAPAAAPAAAAAPAEVVKESAISPPAEVAAYEAALADAAAAPLPDDDDDVDGI